MDALDPRIQAVLDGPNVAIVGTVAPDGSPHLTAVWVRGTTDALEIMVPADARKVSHVQRDGRVEICINAGPVGPCATAVGRAAVSGPGTTEDVHDLAVKYLGEADAADYVAARSPDAKSVLIRVVPDRWRIFPPS